MPELSGATTPLVEQAAGRLSLEPSLDETFDARGLRQGRS